MQWCSDLHGALSELCRVVRPGGTVAFSTLAHGSMPELRRAWQAVDDREHTNRFLPEEQLEKALHGWDVEYQLHPVTLWFDDALSAMRSLKGIGATHLHDGREQRVLTRSQLQQLQLAWPSVQGKYPLTYQLF